MSKGPEPLEGQVHNRSGGFAWEICDMQRLRRFLILGSELGTYYATERQLAIESAQCVHRLLDAGHYEEVLALIEEYSKSGRAPKEDTILLVLAACAVHKDPVIRKAAYEKVNSICNIPTKLFRFLDLTHDSIVKERIANPPAAQPIGRKRKHIEEIKDLKLDDDEPGPSGAGPSEICIEEKPKEPVESTDATAVPLKKKEKKKKPPKAPSKFKIVHKVARKSLGWGRMRRNGIAQFYKDDKKDACRLLYLVTKYKQRNNWSHKDVLTYAHPKLYGEKKQGKDLVLRYCTRGYKHIEQDVEKLSRSTGVSEDVSEVLSYIKVINEINALNPDTDGDEDKLLHYMEKYGVRSEKKETTWLLYGQSEPVENTENKKSPIHVVREHIPTGFLKSKRVWEALLQDMPMTAMIRNLGKMSSMGLFADPENTAIVVEAFTETRLQSARVHPLKILIALQVYKEGKGLEGSLQWTPDEAITKALDGAFYKSFKGEAGKSFKTGKKHLLGLDVSSSMTFKACAGCPFITPAMATAAMAMVTCNIEEEVEVMAFGRHFQDIKNMVQKDMMLNDVMKALAGIDFGRTDCALPMVYALEKRLDIDVFIVYTDNETNSGSISPMDALRNYNRAMEKEAKLIVCALQGNKFSIADPRDTIAMDIVGFDANVPALIASFIKGDDVQCNVCVDCKRRRQVDMEE